MAINRWYLTRLLHKDIHPFVVSIALFDPHVERRLDILSDIEKVFESNYHHKLFIQCDVESRVMIYEINTARIHLRCLF